MSAPAPVHVYQTFIRASAEQVWSAITDPEFTKRYFHRTAFESTLEPGTPYRMVLPDGSDAVVGSIEEVEPNKRLVMTWRILYDTAAAEEPPSRVEWLLTEGERRRHQADHDPSRPRAQPDHLGERRRRLDVGAAVDEVDARDREMRCRARRQTPVATTTRRPRRSTPLRRRYIAPRGSPRTTRRGSCSTVASCRATTSTTCSAGPTRRCTTGSGQHAVARRTPPGRRGWSPASTPCSATVISPCITPTTAMAAVEAAGLDDFDRAYAHEARARALACLGRLDEAAVELKAAHAVPIADAEDKAILDADLAADPWYGLTI